MFDSREPTGSEVSSVTSGSKDVDRVGVLDEAQHLDEVLRQGALADETLMKSIELAPGGERAVEEKVGYFFEAGLGGEVMNRVATIQKDASLTIDVA